jgi:thiosulfate dehydrogenase [quinone] large subunit
LFLGVTFCVAGLQKLANPAFFRASDPASIQSQLAGAARRSPIHALVHPLLHVAVPLGVVIALAELAVGTGTLLGLWARAAAAGGAVLSFFLFLTVSFHSSPYYTGSDIVFLFAWLPLVLVGAGGALSADAVIANEIRRRQGAEPAAVVPVSFATVRRVCGSFDDGRCTARRGEPCEPGPCPFLAERPAPATRLGERELDRRTFTAQSAVAAGAGVVALAAGGLAAVIGRVAGGSSHPARTATLGAGASSATTATTTAATTTTGAGPAVVPGSSTTTAPPSPSTTAAGHPPGTRIGPAADVPVGGAASFQDPTSGDPAIVVQPKAGTFLAFDAVCPHAGCTVEYDPRSSLFICPCHGSEFNGRTGAVEIGPATTGLGHIAVAEGGDGQLYVT